MGYNSVLRPRVVGEWVGREENDADPLAAEMLHPPVPRFKTEVCWSGDSSPAGRLVIGIIVYLWCHLHKCVCVHKSVRVNHLMQKVLNFKNFTKLLLAL